MEPTGAWDAEETVAFLESTAVPVRLSCHTPTGALWMLSLWFEWKAGALWCATSASADVVSYLDHDDRVAFEVSTNEPPYRGVRGNGTATIAPDTEKELLRSLLERYLGGTDTPLASELLSPEREEVKLRIDPHKLYTWDFTERMAAVSEERDD
ncbi:pyridoxamine 5'-phosphate oxidase family protein [Natronomonas sp. EA1]|uniref:pyridoxamine 5'-phosphate oxidase family protein n=1 Tax=Natronomonas sp. EA1 TaxID=3421655 RepID=UPI003EBB9CA5